MSPSAPEFPVLSVENLSLTRNGRPLLQEVNWTVQPAERWVILGANGSGKSSLLGCVTGHLMPTRGSVSVQGNRFGRSDWREVRKSIGWVSNAISRDIDDSETGLSLVMSGKSALLNIHGTQLEDSPADRASAETIMRSQGIWHLAGSRWAWMSQGERQKCLIARAFQARFQLLFLDEPCSGLDPVARKAFLHWIDSLESAPGSPALVMVTHHVEEIPAGATHALLLKEGKVEQAGEIATCLTSANLSRVFGAPVTLSHSRETGWKLEVTG